jgi:glycerophosphoryl diester phosphodiesterase
VKQPNSLITGHRGASSVAPENTLSAFQKAWDIGCDAIEGDFRLTCDGEIICIHDANTRRTTGINREVAQTPLKLLQTLDFGAWKDVRFKGETCPTLNQVLLTVPPHGHFFIELKTGPEIVEPLAKCLERSSLLKTQITLITLNQETGKKCRNFFPDIRIHWLTSFQRHNNHAYACTPSPDQIASVLDDIGANGVGLQAHRDIVTATFLKQLRTENVSEFHMWTVDDPEDALFYISEGAFGITTNNPAALKIRLQSC